MKYTGLILSALAISVPFAASAQTAVEALEFTQSDMKGTARFMSMGGAFGALGGDISTISQNPGGIGVYRGNDFGFTLNLDCQRSKATSQGVSINNDQTKFLLNNIGAVLTLRLNSSAVPNLNFGFTYSKDASFNRRYSGFVPQLSNSMTNYIAALTNDDGNGYPYTENDMTTTDSFDPYFPNDGGVAAPWISILGYQSYLTTPIYSGNDVDKSNPNWIGQWGTGTTGTGQFNVEEYGAIDSYNIALGGNIANVVFWGMDFDIVNFNYGRNTLWGENLAGAYVEGNDGIERTTSNWSLNNYYHASGTGFNYKLGLILKPIQQFRLGFAIHTPTWYSLNEEYGATTNYRYGSMNQYESKQTNGGYLATTDVNFRSPWRFIASAAGVIGGRFILSFDYEWTGTTGMKFSEPSYDNYDYGYDDGWGDWGDDWWGYNRPAQKPDYISRAYYNDAYGYTNQDIKIYTKSTNTVRLGAEFRVTNNFSVRAGYSHVSSPIKEKAADGGEIIYTSDLNPSYRFDKDTNYATCGLGYRGKHFYADLAYVYKNTKSTFHAFTPDPDHQYGGLESPKADLSFSNSQILLTLGVRF